MLYYFIVHCEQAALERIVCAAVEDDVAKSRSRGRKSSVRTAAPRFRSN